MNESEHLRSIKAALAGLGNLETAELIKHALEQILPQDRNFVLGRCGLQRQKPLRPLPAHPPATATHSRGYVRCGKKNCATCRNSQGHGPYWFAYWREDGRLRKKYVGKNRPMRGEKNG